jgi:hypothetical protein
MPGRANLTTTLNYMQLAPSEEHHRAIARLDQLRSQAGGEADRNRGGIVEAPGCDEKGK